MKKSGFIISGIISIVVAIGLALALAYFVFVTVTIGFMAEGASASGNPLAQLFGVLFKIIQIMLIVALLIVGTIIVIMIIFQITSAIFKFSIIGKNPKTIKKFKRGTAVIVFDIIFLVISFVLLFVFIGGSKEVDQTVTWETSEQSIVEVMAPGKIRGLSLGNADITISTADGKHEKVIHVTVVGLPQPVKQAITGIKVDSENITITLMEPVTINYELEEENWVTPQMVGMAVALVVLFVLATVLDITSKKSINKLIKENNARDNRLLSEAKEKEKQKPTK
jgi:hypothetical protein